MIAIGIGCRKACPAEDIVALVTQTLTLLDDGGAPRALFSIVEKRGEPGLTAAATALGLPLTFLDRAVLALVAGGTRSCSRRVEEMFGLPGIAETAALAGAGQGAMLLVPRRGSATATCAVAGPRHARPRDARGSIT